MLNIRAIKDALLSNTESVLPGTDHLCTADGKHITLKQNQHFIEAWYGDLARFQNVIDDVISASESTKAGYSNIVNSYKKNKTFKREPIIDWCTKLSNNKELLAQNLDTLSQNIKKIIKEHCAYLFKHCHKQQYAVKDPETFTLAVIQTLLQTNTEDEINRRSSKFRIDSFPDNEENVYKKLAIISVIALIPTDAIEPKETLSINKFADIINKTYATVLEGNVSLSDANQSLTSQTIDNDYLYAYISDNTYRVNAPDITLRHCKDFIESIIISIITNKHNMIAITGFGGLGKTYIANYIRQYFIQLNNIGKFKNVVYWLDFNPDEKNDNHAEKKMNAIEKTLLSINGLNNENRTNQLDEMLKRFNRSSSDIIIIIDNLQFDKLNGNDYKLLQRLSSICKIKLIITARNLSDDYSDIFMEFDLWNNTQEHLINNDEQKLRLFNYFRLTHANIATNTDREKDTIIQIVNKAHGNILAIELLAKTAKRNAKIGLSLQSFLKELIINGFNFPDQKELSTNKNCYEIAAKQIASLYDINNLDCETKKLAWEFAVIKNLRMTPKQIPLVLFRSPSSAATLYDMGYLSMINGEYYMHDIVRDSILLGLVSCDELCDMYLENGTYDDYSYSLGSLIKVIPLDIGAFDEVIKHIIDDAYPYRLKWYLIKYCLVNNNVFIKCADSLEKKLAELMAKEKKKEHIVKNWINQNGNNACVLHDYIFESIDDCTIGNKKCQCSLEIIDGKLVITKKGNQKTKMPIVAEIKHCGRSFIVVRTVVDENIVPSRPYSDKKYTYMIFELLHEQNNVDYIKYISKGEYEIFTIIITHYLWLKYGPRDELFFDFDGMDYTYDKWINKILCKSEGWKNIKKEEVYKELFTLREYFYYFIINSIPDSLGIDKESPKEYIPDYLVIDKEYKPDSFLDFKYIPDSIVIGKESIKEIINLIKVEYPVFYIEERENNYLCNIRLGNHCYTISEIDSDCSDEDMIYYSNVATLTIAKAFNTAFSDDKNNNPIKYSAYGKPYNIYYDLIIQKRLH